MDKNIQKIAVWGDSILKGVALDPATGRYGVLDRSCTNLLTRETGVEVMNHSRFGCTAQKGRFIMESDLKKDIRCDAAIIEYGGNDCDFDWAKVASAPEFDHQPKTPLDQFTGEVQTMIDDTRAKGIEPILTTLPPLDHNRFFARVSKGLNADAILKWLGDVFLIYRWQESYSNAVARLACLNKCRLIDIRGAFLAHKHYEELLCEDGMHPNERGHRLMADVLDLFFRSANRPAQVVSITA